MIPALGIFGVLVVRFAFYVAAVVVGLYVWEGWVKPRVIG